MYFLEDFFKILLLTLGLYIVIALATIQGNIVDRMSERIDNLLLPQPKQEIEIKLFPSQDNLIFDIDIY